MVVLRYGLLALGMAIGSLGDVLSSRLIQELARVQMKPGEVHPMVAQARALDKSAWTATADSYQVGNEPSKAIDNDTSTFWHSQYNPNLPLPHNITIDMQVVSNLNGLVLTPRQDGNSNGNIGQHTVQVSTDGTTWTTVSYGTFLDDSEVKTIPFTTTPARYLRILATTEAGNRGSWTSIADISVTTGTLTTGSPSAIGSWGPTIEFPVVPVSAAVLAGSGQLLTWSSSMPNSFSGSSTQQTLTSTYDPSTKLVTQYTISNTGHDMFCSGISLDNQGNPIVTGGNNAPATSRYSGQSSAWAAAAQMTTPRGYQAHVTLSDGRVFTIGGSWSGGEGGKNGEIFDPAANKWTALPNATVAQMLTNDAQGVYRADNHAWLFAWKNNYVFQAGPSMAMNWYGMSGNGSQTSAGSRTGDGDAMCGDAVMYDAVNGKILAVGGSPSYQDSNATTNTHIITLGNSLGTPAVQTVASMQYPRAFANGVVLPNGQVFVVGGQSYPVPFSDDTAQFTPELWDPATQKFTAMAPQAAARVYHSIALLMPDGTVFSGGGGLCGNCATNHRDGQFFSPPYLFNSNGGLATRPTISSISATTVKVGNTFTVTTSTSRPKFALIRYGSTTHTVNTDQRRIALAPSYSSGSTHTLRLPSDPGVIVPGQYMVFLLNPAGVPSIAKTILVTN